MQYACWVFRVFLGGMQGVVAPGDQDRAKFVAVIAFVGDQHRCRRQRIEHQLGALVVVHLAFSEQQDQWAIRWHRNGFGCFGPGDHAHAGGGSDVRMTIELPKGQPLQQNKVLGGAPGIGEITSRNPIDEGQRRQQTGAAVDADEFEPLALNPAAVEVGEEVLPRRGACGSSTFVLPSSTI